MELSRPVVVKADLGMFMDRTTLRRLATRFLRLAKVAPADEATRLKLAAADYLEKANQDPGSARQQQEIVPPKKDPS